MRRLLLIAFFILSITSVFTQQNEFKEIHFRITCDMEFDIVSCRFNPETDSLFLIGSPTNWLEPVAMLPSLSDSTKYIFETDLLIKQKERFTFRFFYHASKDSIKNISPFKGFLYSENYFDKDSINITESFWGSSYYWNLQNDKERKILYTVDVNNACDYKGDEFISIENVFITGFNVSTGWPGTSWPDSSVDKVIFLNDDGIAGDQTIGDRIWSVEIIDSTQFYTFPDTSIQHYKSFVYRYGINWGLEANNGSNCNESRRGIDHYFSLHYTDLPYIIVTDTFGVMGGSKFDVITSIEDSRNNYPISFHLSQNYPNPFNPVTTIKFTIPNVGRSATSTLIVYDILGSEIATLVNETKPPGTYGVEFDGSLLASGVYFYRLNAGYHSLTKKMVLMR